MSVQYSDRDILLIILGFFFPPISVFLKRGIRADFWINCGLTLLGWIPGIVHGWWVINKYRDYSGIN
ncbi:hypothetical protein CONCODRAFT_59846 [Conidiobolus coronatus NRRL 28638]|uniref:Uncharacterized protein n=1 Tax=Conidiobolus coronatus (strain ATCC 28846 / CBS 209.66 / NRRL 28638) TaxID=796925 RepID=A0A137P228_CONC2|nr:hypothetical protein CONCODRAFT_59846 [Conidiobolus coronatus NRRL 28638]|eukprot:KXN68941.1 hypothetical protein CONCODRAFT_59846 [Conidiobolus coronatus NRRL 28638]